MAKTPPMKCSFDSISKELCSSMRRQDIGDSKYSDEQEYLWRKAILHAIELLFGGSVAAKVSVKAQELRKERHIDACRPLLPFHSWGGDLPATSGVKGL